MTIAMAGATVVDNGRSFWVFLQLVCRFNVERSNEGFSGMHPMLIIFSM